MEPLWWVAIVVAVVIVGAVLYWRSTQSRQQRDQDRRIDIQAENRAQSPAAAISQREDRRLAGMSTEDRAWEQASLERQRASQEGTPTVG